MTPTPTPAPSWVKVTALTVITAVLAVLATLIGGTREAQAADITVPSQSTVGGFAGGQQVTAADGLIYLPGNQDHVIRVFQAPLTPQSTPVRTITAANGLQFPLGVHVHNGLLYVANDGAYEGGPQGTGWISVFAAGGAGTDNTELRRISGVDRPHDIATDDYYMYVTAFRNSRILVYPLAATGRATPVRTITGLTNPVGLTISGGNIYTANKHAMADQSGSITVHTSGPTGSNTPVRTITGWLAWPTSVAVVNDHVLAINMYNNTVTAHRVTDGFNTVPQWRMSGSPGISSGHGIEVLDKTILVSEWAGATAKNLRIFPLPINPAPVRTMGVTAGPTGAADVTAHGDLVFWVDPSAGRVYSYDTTTGTRKEIATVGGQSRGIAVDSTHVYWTNGQFIGRARHDGSELNGSLINMGAGVFAVGIDVDDTHIYMSHWAHDVIQRANKDGSGRVNLVWGLPVNTIHDVSVNSTHVYWADYSNSRIGRANLDGSGANGNWLTGQAAVAGLSVEGDRLYWADRNSALIRTANVNDKTVATAATTSSTIYGMTVADGKIYWASNAVGLVGRMNLDGSDPVTIAPAGPTTAFDMTVPGDGFVYVSDPGADRILVYPEGRTGSPQQVREIRHPNMVDPFGIAVDVTRELLYVTNQTHGVAGESVQVFRSGGAGTANNELRRISTTSTAACNMDPNNVAIAGDEVFVTSHSSDKICVFRAGGAEQSDNNALRQISGGPIDGPIGITVHNGEVYVANQNPSNVLVYPTALTSNTPTRTISGMTNLNEALTIGTFNGQERLFVASGQATNTISAYPLTANGVTSPTMIITGETRTRVSWARGIDINNGLLYVANTNEPKGVRVFAPEPKLTAVGPVSGRAGTTISLTGENFTGATDVRFAGVPSAFSVVSDTEIAATVPMNPAGPVTVEVATGSGVAKAIAAFTYLPPEPGDTLCLNSPALVNGDFESPSLGESGPVTTSTSGFGWKNTAEGSVEIWKSGFLGVPAAKGAQFAEMNWNVAGTLYQDVATTPGQTMRWSLMHRAREGTGTNTMRVMVGDPSGALSQSGSDMTTGTAWVNYTGFYVVPPGQTTTRFAFQAVSPAGGSGNLLDDISFSIPGCAAPPVGVTANGVNNGAALSFIPGDNGGDPITDYAYSVDGGEWTLAQPSRATSPVTVPGLTNGQTYSIRLRAMNSTAAGRMSEPVTVTAGGPNLGYGTASVSTRTVSSATVNTKLGAEAKLAVAQFPGDSVRVVIRPAAGTVALTSTTGLSAPTGYPSNFAGTEVAFTGTRTAVNSALDSLVYTSGPEPGATSVEISAAAEFAGKNYNPSNGHYYEFITGSQTWEAARAAAKNRTFNGLQGYLATITSAEENAFVTSKTGGSAAWIGGADLDVEGSWQWMDGPEAGQVFWTSACGAALVGNCPATGMFNSFNTTEPNDYQPNGGEDGLQLLVGGSGLWNDLPHNRTSALPMIVEYSEPDGSAVTGVSASRTITVNVAMATVTDDACTAAPQLTNADFDATFPVGWNRIWVDSSGAAKGYQHVNTNTYPAIGWRNTAEPVIELIESGANGQVAHSGGQYAELNANTAGTLYQIVPTAPGTTLRWSLWHRARIGDTIASNANPNDTNTMRVRVGPTGAGGAINTGLLTQSGGNLVSPPTEWRNHTGTYTVPAGQTQTVFAFESTSGSSMGNLLDTITFTQLGCAQAPSDITAVPGDGSASIGFTTTDDGGYPVANMAYSIDGAPWVEPDPAEATGPLVIDGLNNGQAYSIRLRPVNAAGGGRISPAVVVTPAVPPAPPVPATVKNAAPIRTLTATNGFAYADYISIPGDGFVYVADRNSNTVSVFTEAGYGSSSPVRTITTRTRPLGVAVADGLLYVTVHGAGDIDVYSAGGAGVGDARVRTIPTQQGAVAVDGLAIANGEVFATFNSRSRVVVFNAGGGGTDNAIKRSIITGVPLPKGIAVHGDEIFVASGYQGNSRVLVFPRTWTGTAPAVKRSISGSWVNDPYGLTVASDGGVNRLFVANRGASNVAVFNLDASGSAEPVWAMRGGATGLSMPTGIAVANGRVYVSNAWAPKRVGVYGDGLYVRSASPTSGRPNTVVTVLGQKFTGTTSVRFGSTSATSFTVVSDTELRATVPVLAAAGYDIAVTTAEGTTVRPSAFTITPPGADESACTAGPNTPGCAGEPTGLTAEVGDGFATINFTPGSNGGFAITNYAYSVNSGPWTPLTPANPSSPVIIPGLTNNVQSFVRLRAINSAGAGMSTPSIRVTTRPAGLGTSDAPAVDSKPLSVTNLNAELGAAKITVNGLGDSDIRVVASASTGTLSLSTTTGLTVPPGYPADFRGAEIAFIGTPAAVNAALDSLTHAAGTTSGPATITISAAVNPVGLHFNPSNGHYYEFISTPRTWNDARNAAKVRSFAGMPGYLATVTSAAENAFVTEKTGGTAAWLGGTDLAVEGTWAWADGPEAGQVFWTSACGVGFRGTCAATGGYNNFNGGEPNNFNGNEDGLQILAGASGRWNDLPHTSTSALPMVVEYSPVPGVASATTSVTRTIDLNVAAATLADEACVAAPQLVNGDFEFLSPNEVKSGTGWRNVTTEQPGIGWKFQPNNNTVNNTVDILNNFEGAPASRGVQYAELNSDLPGMLYQDVSTVPGQTMRWSLDHRARLNTGTNTMEVLIGSPGGTLQRSGQPLTSGTNSWSTYSGTYTVPAGQTTTRFGFRAVEPTQGAAGNFLDNITFTALGCAQAPTSVTAAAGSDFVTVNFTPADDGGVPVTNYAYTIDGGDTWTALSPADITPPVTIPDLTAGNSYSVALRPVNAAGVGLVTTSLTVNLAAPDAALDTWKTIAMTPDGTLYTALRDSGKIVVFAPGANGNIAPARTITGPATGLTNRPHGIAAAPDGTIYVTTFDDNAIRIFAPDANGDVAPERIIRGRATGLSGPNGITLSPDGQTIWVASQTNRSVRAYNANATGNATPQRVIAGNRTGLAYPRAVAIAPGGKLYVSDRAIRVFGDAANGNVNPQRVIQTGGNTGLDNPAGLVVDQATGTVYVSDIDTNAVRAFAPSASGNIKPVRILTGAQTGLNRPTSLALHTSPQGTTRLYAASPGNNSIRGYVVPENKR